MSLIEKIDELSTVQLNSVDGPLISKKDVLNILSEQKEPCKYCKENKCWLCEYAGECRTVKHCDENNRADYKPRQNFCHICGRDLNQSSTDIS